MVSLMRCLRVSLVFCMFMVGGVIWVLIKAKAGSRLLKVGSIWIFGFRNPKCGVSTLCHSLIFEGEGIDVYIVNELSKLQALM